jgi:hypothetical protein
MAPSVLRSQKACFCKVEPHSRVYSSLSPAILQSLTLSLCVLPVIDLIQIRKRVPVGDICEMTDA